MRVIDSHTEGEPTRMIVEGGPNLGQGPLAERRERLARDFDHIRRFAVLEPRGNDAVVGALLCAPVDPACAAGLIFFNNAGYLGMCGHATIGAAVTLAHMGRIGPGEHRFETPVGYERSEKCHWIEIRPLKIPDSAVELQVVALSRAVIDGECRTMCSPLAKFKLR